MEQKHQIKIKFFRCDNAGENKKIEDVLKEKGYGITFEYTSANTPQQNGMVERCFATRYRRVQPMFVTCRITSGLRNDLLADVSNTSTLLGNILSSVGDKPPHVRFYGDLPRYSSGLRIFGELGIVHQGNKNRSKLEGRGVTCIFVGYSEVHAVGTYRMFNRRSRKVVVNRNVKWLQRTYGEEAKKAQKGIEWDADNFF